MSTDTYTPPPAYEPPVGGAAQGGPGGASPRPARSGWIKPVLVTVGAIVLLVVLTQAVWAGVRMLHQGSSTHSAPMSGVSALRIDVAGGEFSIAYADASEAVLHATGTRTWELRREGNTLVVEPEWMLFGGGCFGLCFGTHERVTLTLPKEYQLRELDGDISVSAGAFTADKAFGDLRVEVSAGSADITGGAKTFVAEVSAGGISASLEGVKDAKFEISAGKVVTNLTGTAPDNVEIEVSAGSLELVVPRGGYRVSSDVSAGSFDNNLSSTSSSSGHVIDVSVSAGSVVVSDGNLKSF